MTNYVAVVDGNSMSTFVALEYGWLLFGAGEAAPYCGKYVRLYRSGSKDLCWLRCVPQTYTSIPGGRSGPILFWLTI